MTTPEVNGAAQTMSLAIYIGTEKFHDEHKGDVTALPENAVTLSDIATEQYSDTGEGLLCLFLTAFTEEALLTLEQWLKADVERTCVVAWPHPGAWLAASLHNHSRPKEALWQWSYQAGLLLKLHKKMRRQVTLQGYVPGAPASDELYPLEGLSLQQIAPIYRLMATQLSQEDSLLQQTYNYLKASSAAVMAWQIPVVEAVEQSLQTLNKEQQQVEELSQRLSEKNAQLLTAQNANDQLQEHSHSVEKENAALLEQLTNVQQALEEKTQQEQQKSANLQHEQACLQDRAYGLEQENAALLDQLMKVQQVLEEYILQHQQQLEKLNEKEGKLSWLRGKTQKQEESLAKQKESLAKQKESVEKQKESLAQQKQTISQLTKQLQNSQVMISQETTEKALITEQLHDTQEQLAKTLEHSEHYQQQAETRQQTINVLKQQYQQERHEYESAVQWLRVSGHRNAAAAYRYSRPFKRALPKQLAEINASQFFDAQWYSTQYPDVKNAGISPAEHYLKFGAIEGRNPSDKFDTYFYISEYPDVASSGQNPLLHYLRYGQFEERLPAKPQQQLPAPTALEP